MVETIMAGIVKRMLTLRCHFNNYFLASCEENKNAKKNGTKNPN